MHVALDATAIGSGLGGDETMVATLARALAHRLEPDDRVSLLAATDAGLPDRVTSSAQVSVTRTARRAGPAHFGAVLPRWLASVPRPDVVVTNTHAPVWSPAPVALVVPDLSFVHRPDTYPPATRWRLRALVPRQARRAGVVVTISEYSRRDLIATLGLSQGHVHTVPLAVDPPERRPFDTARARLAGRGVERPYLLYLGNLHPRKNVGRAIEAFADVRRRHGALARHRFVVAGGRWWSGGDEARAASTTTGVRFVGHVTHDEREVLLQDAEALVYLSEFEGFGLPPLEAMARGLPVLAADATAIPEVCGDGALLVRPDDDRAIRRGLVTVLTDASTRARLTAAGPARAGAYALPRTAAALAGALRAVAREHR